MKKVDTNLVLHYRSRSDAFLLGMQLLAEDPVYYGHSVALLAVHTVISLADAVLIGCTGYRSNEQDHRTAVDAMRKLCGSRGVDPVGLTHFDWLVQRKTDFAYGERSLHPDRDIGMAKVHAERFAGWAYRNFREIARQGVEP